MKWTTEQMPSQKGRVAIVTGANAGLGFEDAKALVNKGAHVVLACRNQGKGQAALDKLAEAGFEGSAELMLLDLSDLNSVREFVDTFNGKFDHLDLLINNAGVMMPPYGKTRDGFELQFGTNHLGHFALTGLLLPRLLSTENSRIVNVSSIAHKQGSIDFDDLNWEKRPYSKMQSYGQSKIANLHFTYELQRRLENAGVTTIATAAHPGWTATELQRHSGLANFLNPFFAQQPWQGALPTLYAATAEDVRGGQYFGPSGFMELRGFPKPVKSTRASHERSVAEKLWDVSEQMTGISYGDILK